METETKLKRIAIIGPESTGKSELAQKLAQIFNTEWVREYARTFIDQLHRDYLKKDLLDIAKGQLDLEEKQAAKSNEILFCDTNLIVIKIWSDFKFGNCDVWIEEQLKTRKYYHYLLCDIDLPWVPDPQREHPEHREELFDLYKNYLESNKLMYSIISGAEEHRIESALKALQQLNILI